MCIQNNTLSLVHYSWHCYNEGKSFSCFLTFWCHWAITRPYTFYPVHTCAAGVECLAYLWVCLSACPPLFGLFASSRSHYTLKRQFSKKKPIKTLVTSALVHTHCLATRDHLFSTFEGSKLLKILYRSFFPKLASIVTLFKV